MEIIVRKANKNDIEQLCCLLKELFSIEKDFVINYNKQKKGLLELINNSYEDNNNINNTNNNNIIFVAEEKSTKKIIGMVSLQIIISTAEGGKVGLLEDLIVHKDCRNKGIGSKLLKTIENYCIENNLLRLSLLADKDNKDALMFYKSKNYKTTNLICLMKKFGK